MNPIARWSLIVALVLLPLAVGWGQSGVRAARTLGVASIDTVVAPL